MNEFLFVLNSLSVQGIAEHHTPDRLRLPPRRPSSFFGIDAHRDVGAIGHAAALRRRQPRWKSLSGHKPMSLTNIARADLDDHGRGFMCAFAAILVKTAAPGPRALARNDDLVGGAQRLAAEPGIHLALGPQCRA